MPELFTPAGAGPVDGSAAFRGSGRPAKPARLEQRRPRRYVRRTLLSFEGLGARARVDLENSIATSIPVFF